MQIHELNNFIGGLDSGAFLAIDDGSDTGKVSVSELLNGVNNDIQEAEDTLNARIDNIIAGGTAPSAAEVTDARLGAASLGSVAYPSLGDAVRGQATELDRKISETDDLLGFLPSKEVVTAATSWTKVNAFTNFTFKAGNTYVVSFRPTAVITVSSYGYIFDSNNTQLKSVQLKDKTVGYVELTPVNDIVGARVSVEDADSTQRHIVVSIENVSDDKSITQMQNSFKLLTDEVNSIKAGDSGFPSLDYVVGNIDSSTGVYNPLIRFRVCSKNIETAPSNIRLTAKTGYRFYAVYYSSGVFSGASGFTTALEIPAGTEYRLVIAETTEDNTSEADVYTFASSILSTYTLLDYKISRSNSIVDSNTQLSLINGFLSSSNGSVVDEPQSHVTDFIKVEEGEPVQFIFAIDSQNRTASYQRRVCFYDSSKAFVSCPTLDWNLLFWGAMYYEFQELVVPSGCAYVRVSLADYQRPFSLIVSTRLNPFNAFGFANMARKAAKDKSMFNGCVPVLHAGGWSGEYPANTVNNLMYNILHHPDDHRPKFGEVDVKCCSDNVWVVSHEQTFEYNGTTYTISNTPSATAILAGLPLAEDFVKAAHHYNFELMWDVGGSGYTSEKLESLVNLTKKYHMIAYTFFATGVREDLRLLAEICPQINLAFIKFAKPDSGDNTYMFAVDNMITGCMMLYLEKGTAIDLTESAYIDGYRSKGIAVGVHGFTNTDTSALNDWADICDYICVPQADVYDYILQYNYN